MLTGEGRPGAELPLDEAHPAYVLNTLFDLGSLLKLRRLNQRCLACTELICRSRVARVEEEQGAGETAQDDGEMRAIDFGLGRGYSGSQVGDPMALLPLCRPPGTWPASSRQTSPGVPASGSPPPP